MFSFSTIVAKSDVIPNDSTGMPDKELYQIVLNTLGKKSGTFTKSEVAKLKELDASYGVFDEKRDKIKSLNGMEYFTNLEQLYLYRNSITNLSSLSKLRHLKLDIREKS